MGKKIGICYYQGGADLHYNALQNLGFEPVKIRYDSSLDSLEGLILPGGESSVQYKYCKEFALDQKIIDFAKSGGKILGTCAGAILLSKYNGPELRGFSLLDINIARNFYGSQIVSGKYFSDNQNQVVFIRAPAIIECGQVEVIDKYQSMPIYVKSGNIHACTFHPELGALDFDNIIYKIFK